MPCVCGAGENFEKCCEPLHLGKKNAETAEQLMRSRYAAFVKQAVDYLEQTHDPETSENFDREEASTWAKTASWQGLEIVGVEGGNTSDTEGLVEFIARYSVDGQPLTHHERSEFRKLDGWWVYVDGERIPVKQAQKVGRNEPCPCGSGKKHKKCCG